MSKGNTTPAHTRTYLGFSANSAIVTSERHDLFLRLHIVQIADGFPQVHALYSLGRLASVLEVHSEVESAGLTCYWDSLAVIQSRTSQYTSYSHLAAFSGSVAYLPILAHTQPVEEQ